MTEENTIEEETSKVPPPNCTTPEDEPNVEPVTDEVAEDAEKVLKILDEAAEAQKTPSLREALGAAASRKLD